MAKSALHRVAVDVWLATCHMLGIGLLDFWHCFGKALLNVAANTVLLKSLVFC